MQDAFNNIDVPLDIEVNSTSSETEALKLGIKGKTNATVRVNDQGSLFHSGHLGLGSLEVNGNMTKGGKSVATEEWVLAAAESNSPLDISVINEGTLKVSLPFVNNGATITFTLYIAPDGSPDAKEYYTGSYESGSNGFIGFTLHHGGVGTIVERGLVYMKDLFTERTSDFVITEK